MDATSAVACHIPYGGLLLRNDWVSEVVRLRRDRPEPLEFVFLSGAGSAFVCAGLDVEASGVVF